MIDEIKNEILLLILLFQSFNLADCACILRPNLYSRPACSGFHALRGGCAFAEFDCEDLRFPVKFSNETPFMFATDLDDTLVGDHKRLAAFNRLWKETLAPKGCKLVYNSGRSLVDYLALRKDWDLLVPDVYIGGCGTQVFKFDNNHEPRMDGHWIEGLKQNWHKPDVISTTFNDSFLEHKYGKLSEKRESKLNPYMFSLCIADHGYNISEIRSDFQKALSNCTIDGSPLRFQICAASVAYTAESTVTRSSPDVSGRNIFIDILPLAAGKGAAQAYIARQLGFGPSRTIVAGDSGNDIPMFAEGAAAAGIIVGNARAELRAVARPGAHYLARRKHAGAILEAFARMGICSDDIAATALCQEAKRERLRDIDAALARMGYRLSDTSLDGPFPPLDDDFSHPIAGESLSILPPAGLPLGLMPPAEYQSKLASHLRRLQEVRGKVKSCVDFFSARGLSPEVIAAQHWRRWPPPAAPADGNAAADSELTDDDDDDLDGEDVGPASFDAGGGGGGGGGGGNARQTSWAGTTEARSERTHGTVDAAPPAAAKGQKGPRTGVRDLVRWAEVAQEDLLRFLSRARPADTAAAAARRDALVREKTAVMLAYRRAQLSESVAAAAAAAEGVRAPPAPRGEAGLG